MDNKVWFDMLFDQDDIFELRVKREDEKGAKQYWNSMSQLPKILETHLPIHEHNQRHIWCGVAPREKVGSSVAKHVRVLWVDLSEDIDTLEKVNSSLDDSLLPRPSMIVGSGNGFHLYWKLDKAYSPDEVKPYVKGVHQMLPSDATHDPTRVMRVPGTMNFKDPENPKPCEIISYDDTLVYRLQQFPKAAMPQTTVEQTERRPSIPLNERDFELFVGAWLDGQKHSVAVGVAGYLRKNLYQSKADALDTIRRIHEAAGYSWPDENLIKVVEDTYSKFWGAVSGLSKLYEFGIRPSVDEGVTFRFKSKPKARMKLIDFRKEIKKQEFWMDGLVGPGMLTIWAAEPKTGKSFSVMQLGHALATGQNIWGFNVNKQVRVLYFQGELSAGMVAERAINVFGDEILKRPDLFGITDKPDEIVSLTTHPELLNDIAENYDVVIVDPISAFNPNDENSSSSVRETLSVFDTLKSKGKAVIIVHHTKKLPHDREGNPIPPSFSDIRGSSAWFAAADAIALQYRVGDSDTTKVKFIFRAAPEREPLKLWRRRHGGFTDDYKQYLADNGNVLSVSFDQLN